MAVLVEGNLDQMATDLSRREAKLAAGWAQYTKERESMKQQIQDELKKEFTRLEALKVELAPKIAAAQKAKEEATKEIEKMTALAITVKKQQETLNQSMADLDARQIAFNERESKFNAWHKEESRRLADENSLMEGKRIANEEFQKQLDARNVAESEKARKLLAEAEAEKAKQVTKTAELARLIESAKRKELILTGEISLANKALDERAKKADSEDQRLKAKSDEVVAQEQSLTLREQAVKEQSEKNDTAKKSIETANLHLQNRQLKFEKDKKEVLLQIENSQLKAELKGSLKGKIQEA